jgi:hypothetical protein
MTRYLNYMPWKGWMMNFKRSWLRQYATRRKVAGSIPDEVSGFLN